MCRPIILKKLYRLILRIDVADETAQCPLATKFGCNPFDEAPKLLGYKFIKSKDKQKVCNWYFCSCSKRVESGDCRNFVRLKINFQINDFINKRILQYTASTWDRAVTTHWHIEKRFLQPANSLVSL